MLPNSSPLTKRKPIRMLEHSKASKISMINLMTAQRPLFLMMDSVRPLSIPRKIVLFLTKKSKLHQRKNDQFDVSEKSNEKFTTGFELDKIRSESQSMFSLPNMYSDQRLSSLLSCDELINDQSQPIMHTSNSMFPMCPSPLNKVINMEDTLDNYEDDEVEKVDFMY